MGTLLLCIVMLALFLLVPVQGSEAAGPSFYATNSLVRIARDAPYPAGRENGISISAAANEYEAAQLVLYGGDAGLRAVNLSLAGPLEDEAGNTLPVHAVAFYREHYVTVTSPSGGRGGGRAGTYADALIPFVNPFNGDALGSADISAAPFEVRAGENQPVYVEFYIPAGAAAGVYRGTIHIVQDGDMYFADVPVSVTVRNFNLPAASSLRTNFQTYDSEHWLGPANYFGYEYRGPEHQAVARAIDELLLQHRLSPSSPQGTGFEIGATGHIQSDPQQEELLLSFLDRPEYSGYSLSYYDGYPFKRMVTSNRQRAMNYLASAYGWFEAHDVAHKLLVMPGDEPQSRRAMKKIGKLARLARDANPDYRVAMTLEIGDQLTADTLFGAVNVPVGGYWSFDPEIARLRKAAGDEIWTYTAVVQNQEQPSPYWQIDFPLLNYRIVPWISYRYGVEGVLYWTTALWGELAERGRSPWSDPCSYKPGSDCYNGEGLLLYPGKEVNFVVPRDAFGAASPAPVYGAVPSLRLKALRDAMEDYEYLVMAAAIGGAEAEQEALLVGCGGDAAANCFHNWNHDATALLEARERLATTIEAAAATKLVQEPQEKGESK
jgi:hypothetical protein